MLKKFLKVALAACLVAGMSSAAMAAENVQFSVQAEALMGQFNPGTKTGDDSDPAYLDTIGRADFQFKLISGKMYVYGEDSQRYTNQNAYLDSPMVRIGYNMANPGQFIEIGKVWIGAPFSYNFAGTTTQATGWGMRSGWHSQSDWGIKYNMLLSPTMGIMAAYTTGNTMTGMPEGTSLGAAWWGVFGPLQARVGIDNETAQDVTTKDAEAYAASANYFGVKYAISDTMSVSFDYLMSSADKGAYGLTAGETFNGAEMAIVFIGKQLGPGDLYFQYASDADTDSADSDYLTTTVYTNLFYKIPLAKGAGVEVVYLQKSATVKTAAGTGDPSGPTTIGGGFYAVF